MDDLPGHLLHKVLFMLDHRSLAMMCCTNRSLQSHIHDPYFESEYSSRIGSGLLSISDFGSPYLLYNSEGSSKSLKIKDMCHVLGSCSGLLLLFINDRLCVTNPLTNKFRFFSLSTLMRFTGVFSRLDFACPEKKTHIGFAVSQTDRTTKSFKIVHMVDTVKTNETRYKFEINAGNSWRRSKTTLTCNSSYVMMKPVYLDGSLHWLRNDGSIIAFNLETEEARLVPVRFPKRSSSKMLLAAGDDRLVLISATEEVIRFYALENILGDPKWVLVMQIKNGVMDVKRLAYWNVEAYDGKCLVLREDRKKEEEGLECCYDRLVHVYDFSANKWAVMDSVPPWSDANRDVFQFTPSPSSVVGLDQILPCDDRRISSISSIMALIDGSSSEEVEQQLRKRSAEHNLLYEQSTNTIWC